TGYLLAGIIGGPYVLHLVDHQTVDALGRVNTLALALIALAGGAELRMSTLREVARSLSIAMALQTGIVLVVMTCVMMVMGRFIPFLSALAFLPLLGVALMWGIL